MGGNRGEKLVSVWKWSLKPYRRQNPGFDFKKTSVELQHLFFSQLPAKDKFDETKWSSYHVLFELPGLIWRREFCSKMHGSFQISWGHHLISATTGREPLVFSSSLQAWLTGGRVSYVKHKCFFWILWLHKMVNWWDIAICVFICQKMIVLSPTSWCLTPAWSIYLCIYKFSLNHSDLLHMTKI